jgi:hypothetical protein
MLLRQRDAKNLIHTILARGLRISKVKLRAKPDGSKNKAQRRLFSSYGLISGYGILWLAEKKGPKET